MARSLDPIVSTEWLASRLAAGDLTIIDVREDRLYRAGHIPGAISIPFSPVSDWADSDDELLLELPPDGQLFGAIGGNGLRAESRVVIVGTVDAVPPPYSLSDAARVATTLIYAGVGDVAILAGGHPKWEREGRQTTTDVPGVTPAPYSAALDREMWVSTEHVKDRIGRSIIIDGRDPDQYFGVTTDPFAGKAGHIPSARSMPMIWVWEADGTYRPDEVIAGMAKGVIGEDRAAEVILYCGVGGYASTWWFLLTQLLGYKNVKIYDGSMEAWAKENALVQYSWTA